MIEFLKNWYMFWGIYDVLKIKYNGKYWNYTLSSVKLDWKLIASRIIIKVQEKVIPTTT